MLLVSSSCPYLELRFYDLVSVVSRTNELVTREPCIPENRAPPNTPATRACGREA